MVIIYRASRPWSCTSQSITVYPGEKRVEKNKSARRRKKKPQRGVWLNHYPGHPWLEKKKKLQTNESKTVPPGSIRPAIPRLGYASLL